MKSSATIFLAAFVTLSVSWGGFVLAPQIQLGSAPQTKPLSGDNLYPLARSGTAEQGAAVYRSLGCVYCHSQQVRQDGTKVEVVYSEAGTNAAAVMAELAKISKTLAQPSIREGLPKKVADEPNVPAAGPLVTALSVDGGKAFARIVPQGADITRGWGLRQSVAQDYAYDHPVQPGTRRMGPDLANVGLRQSDAQWHLLHLYSPASVVPGSTMPGYRFLFEKRRITRAPSPDALPLTGELAPPAGYEVVPTEAAHQLVAYLKSLRVEEALFEAPFTVIKAAVAAPTNSPAK